MLKTEPALTSRDVAAVWPTATLMAPLPVIDFGTARPRPPRDGAPRRDAVAAPRAWWRLSALLRLRVFGPRPAGAGLCHERYRV